MSQVYFAERYNDIMSAGDGGDFVTPYNQEFLTATGQRNPLWRVEQASRCSYPMWDRGEVLRNTTYDNTLAVNFTSPTISFPAMTPTISGDLSLKLVEKISPILLTDAQLYDWKTQKVYALLCQFNIATTQQVSAWTGIDYEDALISLRNLHTSGVVLCGGETWSKRDTVGDIWSLRVGSPESRRYFDGMDALAQMLTLGGREDIEPPPGSSVGTATRHNLFLTEMCLRILENSDNITTAWGDYFGSESRFHTPTDSMLRRKSHGDAIFVTFNGSLVILELSTSHAASRNAIEMFVDKAASWVGVIANSDLDISVIFLDTRWKVNRRALYRGVYSGIMDASHMYAPDEYSRNKALSHIGIANAAWWFPQDNVVSQAATRLMAFSPSEYRFKPFDIPDPGFSSAQYRRNVVINSALALHTPPWMKDRPQLRTFSPGRSNPSLPTDEEGKIV